MSLAIEVRFPHRQFHATAWNKSVNSGQVEWPPSPWRLVRALVAVWHTRHPQLPAAQVDEALRLVGGQADYWLPPTRPGHTRHYMPQNGLDVEGKLKTTLTHDPYLAVDPHQPLVMVWPHSQADAQQRTTLTTLLESMPYFGRAESVCRARLLADIPTELAGYTHAQPQTEGTHAVLTSRPGSGLQEWEQTVIGMRKQAHLTPAGAQWVNYHLNAPKAEPSTPRSTPPCMLPTAMRWQLTGSAPIRTRNGILAADALRSAQLRYLKPLLDNDAHLHAVMRGPDERSFQHTAHLHAHWLWVGEGGAAHGRVTDVVLWVPTGIPAELIQPLVRVHLLPRFRHQPRGYAPGPVQLVQMGSIEQVAPTQWGWHPGQHRTWVSCTPFLRTLHMKKNRDAHTLLLDDVRRQWAHRHPHSDVQVVDVQELPEQERPYRAEQYRRYRWKESMANSREALWVTLTFSEPVSGPIVLGALSHFGFGVFSPYEGSEVHPHGGRNGYPRSAASTHA